MARSRFIYTLKEVASMIGENLELIEEVTANSDNIAEGELVYVRDGTEDGTKGLTQNGIDDLQSLLAVDGFSKARLNDDKRLVLVDGTKRRPLQAAECGGCVL
ncbi:hypothetical protein ACFSOZ_23190 [Mesorhizobium newzealandense]|uniref:Uncharacterized protein n=1 Tax=Mesorhizobium newzealandense TaxID=1300302 RepID=A0ABW4UID3_9HYPH